LEDSRVWGLSLQLYELRSARNWGIGDFEDLHAMVDLVRSLGGDFIGLNPLHAPFLADPGRCSPYEPSNRQYLNPLYIAVGRVPGHQPSSELEEGLEPLRETELVDYAGVARMKLAELRKLWKDWQQSPPEESMYDPASFASFVVERGESLRLHALFEAISAWMAQNGNGTGWHAWPEEYQSPLGPSVLAFAKEHEDDVRFHMWLQWLAHVQLSDAADHAREAGLRIGFYLDLAVGEALDGSATWSEQEAYLSKATIGSPPDPFATEGQDWHLAAIHPAIIAAGDSSPYRRMVTAAMRYAGAIRIDHAAALRRLFLVPIDRAPDGGAYVDYPQDDLLRILADASAEHRCLVIGEDLGMLPEGLQDDLSEARILSYRILSYERDQSGFKPADVYPALALACISTHDHQTLAGWWRGADITVRAEHGIVPPDVTEEHVEERKVERKDLVEALEEADAEPPAKLPPAAASAERLADLVVSAHRFIAKTPSMLAAVRLADLTGEKKPTNIPGTSDSYPNWRPKLSVPISNLSDLPLLKRIAEAMNEERPRH
jgi:4-alpha-glucanotransferase